MGGLLSGKFLFLLFVAMVVLGPERLPGAARTAGRLLSEFRRVTGGLQEEVRDAFTSSELAGPVQELRAVRDELRSTATGLVTAPFAATTASNPTQAGGPTGPGAPAQPSGSTSLQPVDPAQRVPMAGAGAGSSLAPVGRWSGDLSLPPGDPGLN